MSSTESETLTPGSRLRERSVGCQLAFTWIGIKRSLSRPQVGECADQFNAQERFLGATKQLLDTRHPAYAALTEAKGKIAALWKWMTLPYLDKGVRLLARERVHEFEERVQPLLAELQAARQIFIDCYSGIRDSMRESLGELYNPADYGDLSETALTCAVNYCELNPPDWMMEVNPELYRRLQREAQARFDAAVVLGEQALAASLEQVTSALIEKLTAAPGERKIFRDTAVTNVRDALEQFRELNIGSSEELDLAVQRLEELMRGVTPDKLRGSVMLREAVRSNLATVQQSLEVITAPRRRIAGLEASAPGSEQVA